MSLLSLAEARQRVLSSTPVGDTLQLPLAESHGHFLASTIGAPRPVPPCDNSAMDGYAVRSIETRGANRNSPAKLALTGTIYAGGQPSRAVAPGEAVRIFTGAPLPEGADCVVRQEAASTEGSNRVLVFIEEAPGANVRRRGEEIPAGGVLLGRGRRINAYALGVLASTGVPSAMVYRKPRAAILTLGDELRFPGQDIDEVQIFNSNQFTLSGLCSESGAVVAATCWAPDQRDAIKKMLLKLEETADVIITSGGASVGDRDEVKAVLREMGAEFYVDGLALKPGKPSAYALCRGFPFFVLPGNPGASAVAFDQLVRPYFLKRQGVIEQRRTLSARLDSAQRKQAGLTYLVSTTLEVTPDGFWAKLRPRGAGQLLQNLDAEGWAILPSGQADFNRGETVTVELFANPQYVAAI